MSYFADFKRLTGQHEMPRLEAKAQVTEAKLTEAHLEGLFAMLAECLETVAEEEGYSEIDVARTYLRVVENDEYFNAMLAECAGSLLESSELSELLRQSYGGSSGRYSRGGSRSDDSTRAAYAKAFSKQAVADAERRGAEQDAKQLSPSELKKIRSAAAKKAWETRKGKMRGALSKLGKGAMNVVQKVKSFASKALAGKPSMAAQPA